MWLGGTLWKQEGVSGACLRDCHLMAAGKQRGMGRLGASVTFKALASPGDQLLLAGLTSQSSP